MLQTILQTTLAVLVIASLTWAPTSMAFVYTNENFHSILHEQPASFVQHADGSFTGYTETGRTFSQVPIPNQYDIRMHKFMIDEAFFYVTDQGAIFADSDIQALSMYFARADIV